MSDKDLLLPLGVMPENIWKERRAIDLVEALRRYIYAREFGDKHLLLGWIRELIELVGELPPGKKEAPAASEPDAIPLKYYLIPPSEFISQIHDSLNAYSWDSSADLVAAVMSMIEKYMSCHPEFYTIHPKES